MEVFVGIGRGTCLAGEGANLAMRRLQEKKPREVKFGRDKLKDANLSFANVYAVIVKPKLREPFESNIGYPDFQRIEFP